MAATVQPRLAFAVRLTSGDGPFSCWPGETVLEAMERVSGVGRAFIGVKRIPVGCRRGGCGVCRVQVLAGAYHALPQSRDHVSRKDESEGYALACRLIPDSDLDLRPALKPRSTSNHPITESNDRPLDHPNDKAPGGIPDGH